MKTNKGLINFIKSQPGPILTIHKDIDNLIDTLLSTGRPKAVIMNYCPKCNPNFNGIIYWDYCKICEAENKDENSRIGFWDREVNNAF